MQSPGLALPIGAWHPQHQPLPFPAAVAGSDLVGLSDADFTQLLGASPLQVSLPDWKPSEGPPGRRRSNSSGEAAAL